MQGSNQHRSFLRSLLIGLACGAVVVGALAYQRFSTRDAIPPQPPASHTRTIIHATTVESFTLSPTTPRNEEFGVRLISVAADGTTEIESIRTSTRLTSTPGKPFVAPEFGTQGLVLRSASSDTQTAPFDRWSCRTITETATK